MRSMGYFFESTGLEFVFVDAESVVLMGLIKISRLLSTPKPTPDRR